MKVKRTVEIDMSKEYLDKILTMLVPEQQAMFSRMYPTGPSTDQLKTAIAQVESTILSLNRRTQLLANTIVEHECLLVERADKIKELERDLETTRAELKSAEGEITILSVTSNVDQVEVQRRLALLDALEAAGVDNWEGYYLARELL